jgi:hypothetical protein
MYEKISLGQPGAAEQSMRFGLAQPPSQLSLGLGPPPGLLLSR